MTTQQAQKRESGPRDDDVYDNIEEYYEQKAEQREEAA